MASLYLATGEQIGPCAIATRLQWRNTKHPKQAKCHNNWPISQKQLYKIANETKQSGLA